MSSSRAEATSRASCIYFNATCSPGPEEAPAVHIIRWLTRGHRTCAVCKGNLLPQTDVILPSWGTIPMCAVSTPGKEIQEFSRALHGLVQ